MIRASPLFPSIIFPSNVKETFLVESRLESFNQPGLPSAYFQFMVCFDNGKKTILEGYDTIFKTVGMDYMNTNQ